MATFVRRGGASSSEIQDSVARALSGANAADIAALEATQAAQDNLINMKATQVEVDQIKAIQDSQNPFVAFQRQTDNSITWEKQGGETGSISAAAFPDETDTQALAELAIETQARASADNTINSRLDVLEAVTHDGSVQDAALAQEISDRQTADSTEQTARVQEDDAIKARLVTLEAVSHDGAAQDAVIATKEDKLPTGSPLYFLRRNATDTAYELAEIDISSANLISGAGAPTASDGQDGYYYIQIDAGNGINDIWGPKAAGAWPAQADFKTADPNSSTVGDFTAGAPNENTALSHSPNTLKQIFGNGEATSGDVVSGTETDIKTYSPETLRNADREINQTEKSARAWDNTYAGYVEGDLVKDGNSWYQAITSTVGVNIQPSTNNGVNWKIIDFEGGGLKPWDSTTEYSSGDVVIYGTELYVSQSINTNQIPVSDIGDNWLSVRGNYSDEYSIAQDAFSSYNNTWAEYVNNFPLAGNELLYMSDAGTFDFNQDGNPITVEEGDILQYQVYEWVKLGSDLTGDGTYFGPQEIARWEGQFGISNGTHLSLDVGLDITKAEYLELIYRKGTVPGGNWIYTSTWYNPGTEARHLAHYYDNQYHWVRKGATDNTIEIRSYSEAGHYLIGVRAMVTAENGFYIPEGTELVTTRNMVVTSPTPTSDITIVEQQPSQHFINVTPGKLLVLDNSSDANVSLISPKDGLIAAQATGVSPTVTFSEIDAPQTPSYHSFDSNTFNVNANTDSFFAWTPTETDNYGISLQNANHYVVQFDGVYTITATVGQWNTSSYEAWAYLILDLYDTDLVTKIKEVSMIQSRTLEVDGTGNKSGVALSVSANVRMTAGQSLRPRYRANQSSQVLTRTISLHQIGF